MWYRWFESPRLLVFAAVLFTLALAISCGSAAQPEPEAAEPEAAQGVPAAQEGAAPTATPAPAAAVSTQSAVARYIESQGEIQQETNLHCSGSRQIGPQFRPYVEYPVGVDPQTNQFKPWLAERWEMSPDAKSWTFHLRKGVPFHFDYGEFTAKDMVNMAQAKGHPDCLSSTAEFWENMGRAEIINDYEVTFHMKSQALTMIYVVSSLPTGGEFFGLSKAQMDEVGPQNMNDVKPAGTSYYQYKERKLGQGVVYEAVPYEHWRAQAPFKEMEIRWIGEESTRLAGLLAGELHAIALSRDLQEQAVEAGMKVIPAQVPYVQLSILLGGMYFIPGDPDFDPTTPWTDKRVRQAMNVALDREELNQFVLGGQGEIQYVTACCHPVLAPDVYNPQWAEDWEELYGYNPEKAKSLLAEAGYGPDNPVKVTVYNYRIVGEPEAPLMVQALPQYWTRELGFDLTIQDIDPGAVVRLWRGKQMQHAVWPNVFSFRPIQERVRTTTSQQSSSHSFDHPFVDEKYQEMLSVSSQEEVNRIGLEVADFWYYNFRNVPLFWFKFNMTVNPDVIEDWTFLSRGEYWYLIKPAS